MYIKFDRLHQTYQVKTFYYNSRVFIISNHLENCANLPTVFACHDHHFVTSKDPPFIPFKHRFKHFSKNPHCEVDL